MRKLHLVGLTTDRDGLIFTARKGSKSGGYIVPLDQKVLDAIAAAGEQDDGGPEKTPAPTSDVEAVPKRLRSESALTPREMQARLRAGRTIDEVAAEAGVDTEWVARFAVPILAEQAQVVELARGLVYAKPRLGESAEPLGASVLQNLSDRGVFLPDDVANAGWSAFQLHDSVWMVRFRYRSRGRDQEAHWEIDVPAGRLRARNRLASDLGYVGPDRWLATEDELAEPAEGEIPPAPVPATRRRAMPAPAPTPRPSSRLAGKATTTARRAPAPATKKAVGRPAKRTASPNAKAAAATKKAVGRPAKRTPAGNAAAANAAAARPAKRTAARNVKDAGPAKKAVGRPAKRTPARNTKEAPAVKRASTRKNAAVTGKAPTKSAARPATAKSTTRRRPTKAVPAPEAGPAVGSGGVRMAVAQVSTARVAASMATADREPWAAVRRASRAGARPSAGASERRPPVKQAAPRDRGIDVQETVRPFQPRPLPPPGSEPPERRIRKVTLPRPRVTGDGDAPPAVSLPASRRQPQDTEALAVVEKQKRRRLRSR